MNIKKQTSAYAVALAAFAIGTGAQAADAIGFVDVTVGLSKADDPQRKEVHAGFGTVSGALQSPLAAKGMVVVEGELRHDNHQGYILDGDDMQTQGQLGAHYLHDFNGKKAGVFLAYADANHDGGNEHYKAFFGGIEGIVDVSPVVTLYGQAGMGNRTDDDQSSEGFDHGRFARVGAAYSGFANTLLKLEGEYGATDSYEDSTEEGRFWKLSFMGETGLSAFKNLALTYGASYGRYDAKNDPDVVKETTVSVGIRYYFGGTNSVAALKSGLIGLPSIPLRSMSWVPALD